MSKITRFFLLLAALTGASAFGQVVNSCNNGPCPPIIASGGTLQIPNVQGGMNASFEEIITGTPATVSITIQGCMRGGTCDSAMDTYTTVANSIRSITPTTKPYSYFLATATWTGGTNVTVQINPFVTIARGSSVPPTVNVVSVGGSTSSYTGADMCAALATAYTANTNGGIFHAEGFVGNQVCSPTNLNSMNTAAIAMGGASDIYLGCPLYWWVPLQKSVAASTPYPALGSVLDPPKQSFYGCSSGSVANGLQTNIAACTGTNAPQSGCTAPQTHQFAITSTTITRAGGRTYIGFVSSGMDIQPGEPVRVTGGTNTDNDGAFRICQNTSVANLVADPSCPANPTSTVVYAPINSGLVSAAINAAGSGYTAPRVTFSGGGPCAVFPTAKLTQSGGLLNAVFIESRGSGCSSVPTATIDDTGGAGTGGSLTLTIETLCAATCTGMVLHGSIPLIETVDSNGAVALASFGQQFHHLTLDCRQVADCVNFRSMTGNEHGQLEDINLTGVLNRGLDIHTKLAANFDKLRSIRVVAGNAPSQTPACDIGIEAMYFGDYGPHGLEDFTSDFSVCGGGSGPFPTWAIRIDTNYNWFYLNGGHSEAIQYGIMMGDGNPTRGVSVSNWGGPPNANLTTTGAYRSENPVVVKIRSEYFNASCAASVCTTDYTFNNIVRNFGGATTYTISDDNPVGPAATAGPALLDTVTSLYAVDQANNGCTQAISTGQWGSNFGCPTNIAAATGGNYFGQPYGSASTAIAGTASNVTLWGPFYNYSYLTGLGHINVVVITADATADTYELGIVGPCVSAGKCAKVASTGSIAGTVFAPTASTAMNLATTASFSMAPGRYYLALACGTGCTASLLGAQNMMSLGKNATAGTTISAFQTAPSDTSQSITTPMFMLRP